MTGHSDMCACTSSNEPPQNGQWMSERFLLLLGVVEMAADDEEEEDDDEPPFLPLSFLSFLSFLSLSLSFFRPFFLSLTGVMGFERSMLPWSKASSSAGGSGFFHATSTPSQIPPCAYFLRSSWRSMMTLRLTRKKAPSGLRE